MLRQERRYSSAGAAEVLEMLKRDEVDEAISFVKNMYLKSTGNTVRARSKIKCLN